MYKFFLTIVRNDLKENLSWLYFGRYAVDKGERSQSVCISKGFLYDIDLPPTPASDALIGPDLSTLT